MQVIIRYHHLMIFPNRLADSAAGQAMPAGPMLSAGRVGQCGAYLVKPNVVWVTLGTYSAPYSFNKACAESNPS